MTSGPRPRILFEVAHPAHVHMFRHMATELADGGAEVRWSSRDKDSTLELLERFGIDHVVASRPAPDRTRAADAAELVRRARTIREVLRSWRPHVLLTRNPSGVLAGLGTRTWTVFDTDDGRAVGAHHLLAAPFADVVTSSVLDPASHGPRHRRYPGLKSHAYLHASRYRPDPEWRARLELGPHDGRLSVLRLSRHDASHDRRTDALSDRAKQQVLDLLRAHGAVVLSVEGEPTRLVLRDGSERLVPADAFHDLLAQADVCVTDGQSVAAEAAVLGVPAFRLSGFSRRVWYLELLEDAGLVRNFQPGEEALLVAAVAACLTGGSVGTIAPAPTFEDPSADVTAWFVRLVTDLAGRSKSRRPGPVRVGSPVPAPASEPSMPGVQDLSGGARDRSVAL
jgi:uncharacterized protein